MVLQRFGGGAVLVGQKAVKAGLADRLGSFEQVVSELAAGRNSVRFKTKATAVDPLAENRRLRAELAVLNQETAKPAIIEAPSPARMSEQRRRVFTRFSVSVASARFCAVTSIFIDRD